MNLDNEKELENYLAENYTLEKDVEMIHDLVTGTIWHKEFQQLKIGNYGITDLVRIDYDQKIEHIKIQITELKKGSLNKDALFQICRYKKGFERLIEQMDSDTYSFEFHGVLVGSSLEISTDFIYAAEQIDWLDLYTFDLSMEDGVTFKHEQGYKLRDECFDGSFENDLFNMCLDISEEDQLKNASSKKVVGIS